MRPARSVPGVAGKPVRVEVETDYPFADTVRLTVHADEAVRFPLRLRIPAWTSEAEATIDGKQPGRVAGTFHVVEREWKALRR